MTKKIKKIIILFTVTQLRKLLEVLYNDENLKDTETQKIIKHLQNTLYKYTGCWWV